MSTGTNHLLLARKYFINWLGVDKLLELESKKEENLNSTIHSQSNRDGSIALLRERVSSCLQCRLCNTRSNVVFGEGQEVNPPIMFIGEGPGAEEDKTGRPFVGKAGELLTSAIEKGLKLQRSDVYIANVVKCRPPENRAPLPDEIEACRSYLESQIEFINPQIIVTLGGPALKTLTDTDIGITKARGSWHRWKQFKIMPTFHPAYILRNPSAKKEFWEDLKLVINELGL